MKLLFADRMKYVKKSFIREILKITQNPEVISFAGGLPNPSSFPLKEIEVATQKVLEADGNNILQYGTTEGYLPLRNYIAKRYNKRFGLDIRAEDILITNGSQQALDLLSKVFIDEGDDILIESPAYLGAIQSLSFYQPNLMTVTLNSDGVDLKSLAKLLETHQPKFFYSVPTFQNPSGLTYSPANRKALANLLVEHNVLLVEDDPYSELRFLGEEIPPIKCFMDDYGILLGSFSKIVSPGMRLGWVVACPEIMDKLVIAKQAADLHTNNFSQRVVYQYLIDNDLDAHIEKIKVMYKSRCIFMGEMIKKYFPPQVQVTQPEGGMFMWATLPDGISSMKLMELAGLEKVAFVPGDPFYVSESNVSTLRLNFTNSDNALIEEGIKRLGSVIQKLMDAQ